MTHDVAVLGGGIVGCATALALSGRPGVSVLVLEAEDRLAAHQTGHNSGVVHSGLYYKPGSLKATLCVRGREAMFRFCAEHGIPCERCGKLVVAADASQVAALDALLRRGEENGLRGVARLGPDQIREREPNVGGVAGLLVPETGIVDYTAVTERMADLVRRAGGEVRTGARALRVVREEGGLVVETTAGSFRARNLVNCTGLQSDRVARLCGVDPGVRIVPFRGEYRALAPSRAGLVRHLVYPVPDPRFPFLGVHFTRMIGGGVEAGPNAVLAFARHGYSRTAISARDLAEVLSYAGFWRMAARWWRTGLGEFFRSFSRRAFVASLRRLVPEIGETDLLPGGAGVRAQAVDPSGALVDDFRVVEAPRMVHVLNAPSPAATASLAIGEYVADHAARAFGLPDRGGSPR